MLLIQMFFISVFNLIILLCVSEAIEFEDEDTIIIEAANSETNPDIRQQRQFVGQVGLPPGWPFAILGVHHPLFQIQQPGIQTPKLPKPTQQPSLCRTSGGEEGLCASLRSCYTVLRNLENDTIVNSGLAEALSSASGPCRINDISTDSATNGIELRQSSICCPSQQPKKPTQLLPRPTIATASTQRTPYYRPPFFGHRPPAEISSSTESTPTFVQSNCGKQHIVGGSETGSNKYPWVIALLNGRKQICGGSLIDSLHVLTASHCVAHMNQFDVAKLRILLGAHNLYQVSSGTVVKKVSRLVKHRLFSHRTLHNDIAILKMDSAVSFTDKIRPICLTNDIGNRYENQVAIVSGWGSVGEHSPQPQALRDVAINIWTNEQCRSKYGGLAPGGIMDHMMCAGSTERDACRGDSGGPLMIQTNGIYKQIGIVSWGIGCGRFPGVYTRITHFLDWIEKNRL